MTVVKFVLRFVFKQLRAMGLPLTAKGFGTSRKAEVRNIVLQFREGLESSCLLK